MTVPEPALLDLQNISVMRGEKVVLEDFNLVIRGDEHVAILGPNGCGKSTLIKTITRECYPVARDGSSMTILGQDRWDVFELRAMLGIVSNDLLSRSSGDVSGRDVVLSGFFSSARIWSTRSISNWLRLLWRSSRYRTWPSVRLQKCPPERPGAS
jgi:iron complex transport system ATP-binding protein